MNSPSPAGSNVLQDLPRLIERAKAMALYGISFLAADVGSTAFGREQPPGDDLVDEGEPVALVRPEGDQ